MRKAALLSALILGAVLPATARAVTIRNLTTNTVLFSDNFEGVSPVSTSPAVDNSGVYNPVAQVGTWQVFDSGGTEQVTSSTTSPDPGPAQGNNYLRIYRDPSHLTNELDGIISGSANSGDLVKASLMVYVPNDGRNAGVQILLAGSGAISGAGNDPSLAAAWVRTNGAGSVDYVGPGFSISGTGISYTPNVWQEWDINYQIGAGTFTLSVGGVTSGNITSTSGFSGIGGIVLLNSNNSPGSGYFDAVPVPEPSTLVLLITGMTGLFVASRHCRLTGVIRA